MRAAYASVKITPPIGLPIGGNIREDNISRGIHDDLLCNIIILEENKERVCFLSFDLIALSYNSCKHIKSQIEKASGFNPEKIIITATHTHSGPEIDLSFKDEMDEGVVRYLQDIAIKVSQKIALMVDDLKEVEVKISKSYVSDLSFNRRLFMKDGQMRMNWEGVDPQDVDRVAGPIDPDLFVITIYSEAGNIAAVMVNFTLHPAVLVGQDWLWSRDYINYLNTYIKEKLGEHIVVFFANGAEGNVNHINYMDRNQGRGFKESERIGRSLGKYVVDSISSAEDMGDNSLKCIRKEIKLPLRPITKEAVENAKKLIAERGDYIPSLLDGIPDEVYAREIIKLSKNKEKDVETEIHAVRIGDSVITTLPGEIFVEFGLQIKSKSPFKNTLVFGLTNDIVGYVPTYNAFDEGGYEIKTASSSKLDRNAGDILASEVVKLVESINC